jgi:hypothetical protein
VDQESIAVLQQLIQAAVGSNAAVAARAPEPMDDRALSHD